MKNVFKLMLLLLLSSSVMFTSCKEESERGVEEASLESRLANSEDLKDVISASAELSVLISKTAPQAEIDAVLQKIATSAAKLYEKFPQLGDMTPEATQALFARVISSNENLMDIVAGLNTGALKACPLKDICKLGVTIGNLFLRPVVCDAIVGAITIPIIGPAICTVVMTLITGILNGICDAVPC